MSRPPRIEKRNGQRKYPRATSFGKAYALSLARLWDHPQTSELQIRVNVRLNATLARWVTSTDVIELSRSATRRIAVAQREIICHEAAHRVVCDLYGTAVRPHGPEWRALVEAAGFEPKATLVKCGESRRRALGSTAYRHVCPVCQFSKLAKRRMTRWRCPECHAIGLEGRLNVERVVRREGS